MMNRIGNEYRQEDKEPRLVEEQVREYLEKLDAFKSAG